MICDFIYFFSLLSFDTTLGRTYFFSVLQSERVPFSPPPSQAFQCDGQNDCGDMSDEMDCPSQCNFYTQSSGESIESPDYPKKYGANLDCKWTLEGPIGHNVILQFSEFDTERNFDTVQILSGGRTEDSAASLTTLSGRQDLTNKLFISASNFMIVKFKTDASVEKRGFRWVWPHPSVTLTTFSPA